MKTAILLLSFFLLTINIYSQLGYPEPVTTGKHFLVNSAGLPEEFLLFSPDTATQILFNPARANDFSGNFIFVNYLSDYASSYIYPVYAKHPTFSAAALINIGSAKWLFELTNGIITGNTSLVYKNDHLTVTDPVARYTSDRIVSSQVNRADETITSFKISRIFTTDELNLSAGLYGIIMTNNSSTDALFTNEHYTFKDVTPIDSSAFRDHNLSEETRNYNDKETRYVIGLDFTAGTELFDYVGSIDYQFGDNSFNNISNPDGYSYDSLRYSPSVPWSTAGWKIQN